MRRLTKIIGGLCFGVAALAVATPAMAQDGEIVVQGHYGRSLDNADSLSQAVSFADLDLSTREGQDVLDHRIKMTARYLCDRLGESDSTDPVAPSCRETAYHDAIDRLGTEDQNAAPRRTAWAAPAWQPPYPSSWDNGYDNYTGYP